MLSGALIELSDMQERLEIKGQRVVLVMSAIASVDESVLLERVAALSDDKQKADKIKWLSLENQRLQILLDQLTLQIDESGNAQEGLKLAEKQYKTLSEISNNREAASSVFAPGELYFQAQLPSQAEIELKKKIDERIDQIDREFFDALISSARRVDVQTLKPSQISNDLYELRYVPAVEFESDLIQIKNTLVNNFLSAKKYSVFRTVPYSPGTRVSRYSNGSDYQINDRPPLIYSEFYYDNKYSDLPLESDLRKSAELKKATLDYLKKQRVYLEIEFHGIGLSEKIPVYSANKIIDTFGSVWGAFDAERRAEKNCNKPISHTSNNGKAKQENFAVCVSALSSSLKNWQTKPLKITVTGDELKKITGVSAKLVKAQI